MATKSKTNKAKKTKPEQLKIEGTGRTDAIEELERAAELYREARDARMELGEEEVEAQNELAALLKKHKRTEYVYEGPDGKKYRAYIPTEAKAKVRKVTEKKAPNAAE